MQYRFDRSDLLRLGLYFETTEAAELFLRIITEEYEIRIGTEMDKYLPKKPLSVFDEDTDEDVESWVAAHPEETHRILSENKAKLCDEIKRYRREILGKELSFPPEVRSIPLEDLDLTDRSYQSLTRADIFDIGGVLDHGDLSDIRRLSDKSRDEIMRTLAQLAKAS